MQQLGMCAGLKESYICNATWCNGFHAFKRN